jgi:signal transduction histidine kinase/CheY-like chemotaxis protein
MSSEASNRDLHRFLFEHALDAVVVLDRDGSVAIANRAARELRGVPLDRLFAPHATWREAIDALRREVTERGAGSIEVTITTLQGGPRQLLLRAEAHGAQHVLVVRDVTDLRQLESELRHLRRIESVGQLTASVVHDFNNLLTPIVCLSGLLQKGLEDDPRHAEFARDVRSASERAAGLVRQVLSLARRTPTSKGRVNLGSAITELRALLERVAGPGVEVDLVMEDDSADVVLDREQLEHVVLNLTANARDAMPRGGRVVLRTKAVDLDPDAARAIEGSSSGSYVVVTVTDTGVGMTSEVRERVFERFFTTKGSDGSGLGLAGARRFVGESGGCITMHSEPGNGTTVALYFPRAEAPPIPSSVSKIPAEPPRGTEGILVIDDDRVVRGAHRAVLEERGYTVYDAGTAEEAVAIAQRRDTTIDLVVVDVVLGATTGRDASRRVRAIRSDAKVLYTSGHTTRVLEKHGIAEGDPGLLRKAFTPSALARKVRAILDSGARDSSSSLACGTAG